MVFKATSHTEEVTITLGKNHTASGFIGLGFNFVRWLMYEGLEENISPKSDALGRKLHLGSGRICPSGQKNEALWGSTCLCKTWIQYYIPV